jgi:hypothetical protein
MPQIPYERPQNVHGQYSTLGETIGAGVQNLAMGYDELRQDMKSKDFIQRLYADANKSMNLQLEPRPGETPEMAAERVAGNKMLHNYYAGLKSAEKETILPNMKNWDIQNLAQAKSVVDTLNDKLGKAKKSQAGRLAADVMAGKAPGQKGTPKTATEFYTALGEQPGGGEAAQMGAAKPYIETLQKAERERGVQSRAAKRLALEAIKTKAQAGYLSAKTKKEKKEDISFKEIDGIYNDNNEALKGVMGELEAYRLMGGKEDEWMINYLTGQAEELKERIKELKPIWTAKQKTTAKQAGADSVRRGTPAPGPGAGAGLSEQDRQAIAWAKANPGDPRAARILQMHGAK